MTHFRRISDEFSDQFRSFPGQLSTFFRHFFDNLELHFDELMDYARTMVLSKRFKRGLWDAIPLPRTTPDKHENYHQCVWSISAPQIMNHGWRVVPTLQCYSIENDDIRKPAIHMFICNHNERMDSHHPELCGISGCSKTPKWLHCESSPFLCPALSGFVSSDPHHTTSNMRPTQACLGRKLAMIQHVCVE